MKSPQVIQQLKKYQSLRRNQFLLRCQAGGHTDKKPVHAVQDHSCERSRETSIQNSTDASCSHLAAFSVGVSTSNTIQPVTNPVVMNAMVTTSAADSAFGAEIWSKSDSAFMSFTNVSNSQSLVWCHNYATDFWIHCIVLIFKWTVSIISVDTINTGWLTGFCLFLSSAACQKSVQQYFFSTLVNVPVCKTVVNSVMTYWKQKRKNVLITFAAVISAVDLLSIVNIFAVLSNVISWYYKLVFYTVSQKMHQLWNGIAQNCKDWFWWFLAEIFKSL